MKQRTSFSPPSQFVSLPLRFFHGLLLTFFTGVHKSLQIRFEDATGAIESDAQLGEFSKEVRHHHIETLLQISTF
jgi:hypothetical protein